MKRLFVLGSVCFFALFIAWTHDPFFPKKIMLNKKLGGRVITYSTNKSFFHNDLSHALICEEMMETERLDRINKWNYARGYIHHNSITYIEHKFQPSIYVNHQKIEFVVDIRTLISYPPVVVSETVYLPNERIFEKPIYPIQSLLSSEDTCENTMKYFSFTPNGVSTNISFNKKFDHMCNVRNHIGKTNTDMQKPKHVYTLKMNNAYIIDGGLVLDQYNRMYWSDGLSNHCGPNAVPGTRFFQKKLKKAVILAGPCWSYSFQHFVQDHVGRIGMLSSLLFSDPSIDILVNYEDEARNLCPACDLLRDAGFKNKMIHYDAMSCGPNSNGIYVEILYYVGVYPQLFPWQSPCFIDVGKKYTQKGAAVLTANSRKSVENNDFNLVLYIRRTGSRVVSNEIKVINVLKSYISYINHKYGKNYLVEVLNPSMKRSSLWKKMNQGRLIVSPHGGAVANIIACRPHTVLVEFIHECGSRYRTLAQSLDLKYVEFPVKPRNQHNANFKIPLGSFNETLLYITKFL